MTTASRLGDMIAAVFSRDPTPTAQPSRLIQQSDFINRPPPSRGVYNPMQRMTKETLKQIINSVNTDPLAGMGSFSKEDILIDRLLAHWNTVEAPTVRSVETPKPIINEPPKTNIGGVGAKTVTGPAAIPQNATKTA